MQYTNSLVNASSPYLLQHAHNPVNWNEWTDEVLQLAIQQNKPILVSIGYSACHWCHVMERESFEDPEIASIMNRHFINIKIDREERPDIDHIYMDALQAMTGSGGWPLNIFLTPNLQPFFGGTYFPPKAAHGRMSWQETLLAVANAFDTKKDEIFTQANKLMQHLQKANSFGNTDSLSDTLFTNEHLETITQNLLKNGDTIWGGFGNAPKFPQTYSIIYLLRQYHFTKNEAALQQALLSLDKMMMGGIFDHLAGGFSRYSTDEKWQAPHFEKMLYDNALLVNVYAEAYQITKNIEYKNVIDATLAFVERELMSKEFAFYSALDADSEGVEGKFYTWNKTEIDALLQEDSAIFCNVYNILPQGNWEHTNIIWLQQTIENFATQNNLSLSNVQVTLAKCRQILLTARANKIRPQLDDKVLLSWNALMAASYCKAYQATTNNHYLKIAQKNIDFILEKMYVNNTLFHSYKNGKQYIKAFIEDYAYLIEALIKFQEIIGGTKYLILAKKLLDEAIFKFSDENDNYFYFTEKDKKDIIFRKKEVYDGAMPSANAVLCWAMQYLNVVFCNNNLHNRFQNNLIGLLPAILKHPTSFAYWATVLQNQVYNLHEIVIASNTQSLNIISVLEEYIPNKIIINAAPINRNELPILEGKNFDKTLTIYLCKNNQCLPEFSTFANFLHFVNK
jgi:uncharacterized protein